ncbi:MAG: hypothetical protein HY303_10495 [Candidatus Wallbacteria bacterium]|nr:hypothetical protein [Candidatus Wallbacteria bacterium]
MNGKTMATVLLAAALSALPAGAQGQYLVASFAPAPAAVQTTASRPVVLASVVALPSHALSKAVRTPAARSAGAADAAPVSNAPRAATGEVSSLQALKWIYAVVTCHDSTTCERHTKGLQVNFALPY